MANITKKEKQEFDKWYEDNKQLVYAFAVCMGLLYYFCKNGGFIKKD